MYAVCFVEHMMLSEGLLTCAVENQCLNPEKCINTGVILTIKTYRVLIHLLCVIEMNNCYIKHHKIRIFVITLH